ncbi:chemotaxis protein CheX [Geotoga petraea]|jgi:chemotaxis protein CheX|uniref:Chemotaxis protein CheX n=1 Tax=Geotoga petraea TaxID=28234 RepID=A0A1G6NNY0_9BACT|nr:chemotaxis protein CheX [Geotoga petraea]MDK2946158.1 chemotaxis protein CheX [Geotoga sp.]TGG87817.1 chemotaxis protein CheX [Geotoga petraea]SDC68976.1 chemotaxis protein CheX [Geotoga petraea]
MIDVKVVNAVLNSLVTTFKSAAKTDIKIDKPQLMSKIDKSYEVVTTIGFNGVLEGNLIYTLNEESGKNIVNNMMEGMMQVDSMDDMALSAIGELGNMISGAVAISMEKIGYSINITPPSVVEGKEMKVSVDGNILKFKGLIDDTKEIDLYLVVKR